MGVDRAVLIVRPGARGRAASRSASTRSAGREREPVAYILGRKGFRRHRAGGRPARADPAAGDRARGRGGAGAAARARGWSTSAPARARSRWRWRTSGRTCAWWRTELSAGRAGGGARERGAARASRRAARGRPARAGHRAGRRRRLQPALRARPARGWRRRSGATSRRWRSTPARTGSTCLPPARRPRVRDALAFVALEVAGWAGRRGVGGALRVERLRTTEDVPRPRAASTRVSWGGGDLRRVHRLRRGRRVFPADTVYGLACDPDERGRRRAALRAQGPAARQAGGGDVLRPRAGPRRAARSSRRARAR